jgi:predicted DNA-binding transcriptional regulator AlpA
MSNSNKILNGSPNYLTVAEVAALRGVVRQTVFHWMKNGLPFRKDRFGKRHILRSHAAKFKPRPVGFPANGVRKMTLTMYIEAKRLRSEGKTYAEIALAIGMSQGGLYQALKKRERKRA